MLKKLFKLGPVLAGMLIGAGCVMLGAAGAQVYYMFQPGGALSGSWNSQNVNLGAGSSYILGTLPCASGGTGVTSYTKGDLLVASGSCTLTNLSAGTSGYVLTSNGAGAEPTYQASGSGCGSMQTFTATLTGFSGTAPSGTIDYWICNTDIAYLYVPSAINGTSNATTLTFTGLPSALQPATTSPTCETFAENNSALVHTRWQFTDGSGTVTLNIYEGSPVTDSPTGFTNTGTKGLLNSTLCVIILY